MRTRTSWLAWMLTAGITLAPSMVRGQEGGAGRPGLAPWEVTPPAANVAKERSFAPQPSEPRVVRGQDVPSADPIFPFPLWHRHADKGGFFTAAEFVFFRTTRHLESQVVAVRGLVDADGSLSGQPPGFFLGSGKVALTADDLGPNSYMPGWRLTAGWRFSDGLTVTFDWMHLQEANYVGGAANATPNFVGPPDLSDTFLFAGVFNFNNDWAGPFLDIPANNNNAPYGIWNGADEMTILFTQRYDEYNLTFRVPVFQSECDRFYGIIGARLAALWERWEWRTVDRDFLGRAGPQDVAEYSNIVSQRMYGPFIGCGNEYWCGNGLAISLDLQAALLVDIIKERVKYERADMFTQAKRGRSEYKLVPELVANLNLWWYPIEGIQFRAGYNVMAFFNTIAAKQPVAWDMGNLAPPWETTFVRFFDGLNAGVALIW